MKEEGKEVAVGSVISLSHSSSCPPLYGCYLLSQIFAKQSEAGIRIRSSKGVD